LYIRRHRDAVAQADWRNHNLNHTGRDIELRRSGSEIDIPD